MNNHELKKGIGALLKALALSPDDPEAYFNVAAGYSLDNNAGNGFKYLLQALEKGYKDYGNLLQDNDLQNLRNEPEFKSILQHYFPDKVK